MSPPGFPPATTPPRQQLAALRSVARLALLLAAACFGTTANASISGGDGSLSDPAADTLGSSTGQPDVTRFSALQDEAGLHIRLNFSGSDARPEGLIELDIDGNAGTGVPSAISALCPGESALGAELRIDLFAFDPATSTVALRDHTSAELARLEVQLNAGELGVTLPPAWLQAAPAHLAAAIGSTTELTDCVPDPGFLVAAGAAPGGGAAQQPSVVPALSPFALLLAGCLISWLAMAKLRR